jgi:hypothetical protein
MVPVEQQLQQLQLWESLCKQPQVVLLLLWWLRPEGSRQSGAGHMLAEGGFPVVAYQAGLQTRVG